jgi:hypothetical protein
MSEYYDSSNDFYNDNPGGSALVQNPMQGFSIAPIAPNQINTREHRQLARRADLTATSDRYQAQLAHSAIVHSTALSALADQAVSAVPSCEQPVRGIVNVYARSAAERIARW